MKLPACVLSHDSTFLRFLNYIVFTVTIYPMPGIIWCPVIISVRAIPSAIWAQDIFRPSTFWASYLLGTRLFWARIFLGPGPCWAQDRLGPGPFWAQDLLGPGPFGPRTFLGLGPSGPRRSGLNFRIFLLPCFLIFRRGVVGGRGFEF